MKNQIKSSQINKILPNYLKANIVPFLVGEAGLGKSATVKNLANQLKTKCFVLSVNTMTTKEDITGVKSDKSAAGNDAQVFFPALRIQEAIDYADNHQKETPILFLDEINRSNTDVTSAILSIITEREVGNVKLPANLRLIAAGNDVGHVVSLDTASTSRMAVIHFAPDADEWLNLTCNQNPFIQELIKNKPDLLQSKKVQAENSDEDDDSDDDFSFDMDNETLSQITVPRTLTMMSQTLDTFGSSKEEIANQLLKQNLYNILNENESVINNMIIGQLGETETAKELYQLIIDEIKDVIAKRKTNFNSENSNVTIQKPDSDLLNQLNIAASKEDVETLITKKLPAKYSDKATAKHEAEQLLYEVINPSNVAGSTMSANQIIDLYSIIVINDLIDDKEQFKNNFVYLAQNNKLRNDFIENLKTQIDDLSIQLVNLAETFN